MPLWRFERATRRKPKEALPSPLVCLNWLTLDMALQLMMPVYVRGEAHLAVHEGAEAEAEFQKILDHRGLVGNWPIGELAPLGLGLAYALQGHTAKARAAYRISSRYGRTPILTFPSYGKPKANTRNSNSTWHRFFAAHFQRAR